MNLKKVIQKGLSKSVLRYLLIGGTASVTEYISFLLLLRVLNYPVIVANGLSFCLGLAVSFILNRLWTFPGIFHKRTTHQLALYVSLALINLLLTLGLVGLFRLMGINPLVGKLIAMAITSLWNFIIFKQFIFNHRLSETN